MHTIGEIALNISLILYIILYLPQLIHNLLFKKLASMSLAFHFLLFIAATADLYYAFGRIAQWQYKLVSCLMFVYILMQHIHLFFYVKKFKNGIFILLFLSAIVIFMLLLLPISLHANLTHVFIIMGWIERAGYWLYALPQIIKNKKLSYIQAISPLFICLAIFTAICDTVSAWVFSWGSPSLYGAPISIILHIILLLQFIKLNYSNKRVGDIKGV